MKKLANIAARLLTLIAAVTATSSCDSMIYQYEGDCDPYYKARFVFDYNMLYADAFPSQVKAVTLYLIDPETGAIVWQKSESGAALSADGYLMDLDVAPGTYEFVAWCGEGAGTHFAIPGDATHHTHLTATLGRDYHPTEGHAMTREDISPLFHGHLEAQVFPDDEGTYIYTVPLIKDTNDVNIVLQHLSGETVDKDDYTFTITDANGSMDWDNSLLPDETITYYAHHKYAGSAGFGDDDTAGTRAPITTVSACVAEHTISRLVKGQDTRVKIHNKDGKTVVDIPLIDYALLVKGSHNRQMDDQEFLDRQDKYDLVFFLDEKDRWVSAHIYILSWKLVIQNTSL
ncbi:MAG: FimB/Mfa2 family fimbrial subunit [Muribaculaceae bacterium]|nr:FimB/Mfa2 family fimbrial subunit [Muribaculaceae bacterium]